MNRKRGEHWEVQKWRKQEGGRRRRRRKKGSKKGGKKTLEQMGKRAKVKRRDKQNKNKFFFSLSHVANVERVRGKG